MRIVITGTPGVGKTKTAEQLSKHLGLELIKLSEIAKQRKLVTKKHEVDIKKLAKELECLQMATEYVIEGHLACEFKLPCDHIFILRCHPIELRKRLKKRKYNKAKIEENLLSEVLDYCTQRVEAEYEITPVEIETTKRNIKEVAEEIIRSIKLKKKKIDVVRYSLKEYLGLKLTEEK